MIKIDSAAQARRLLSPNPTQNFNRRQRRQDAGRRPFVPCEQCRGRGIVGPPVEGADPQLCDDCSGSGRAQ